MVAIVVIKIGRSRVLPASTVASISGCPRLRSTLAKSTSSTPLLTTMPTIMITPMKLFTDRVVPVRYSASTTPARPSGTLHMITSGSSSDLNCAASTMYTSATASSPAKPRPENASCCAWL